MFDTIIELAIDAVTEITEAVITRKLRKKGKKKTGNQSVQNPQAGTNRGNAAK